MRENLFAPGGSLGTWLQLPYVSPSWHLLLLVFHFVAGTPSNCDSRWVPSTPFFSLVMTYRQALSRAFLCRASWFLHFFSRSKERYAKNWMRRTNNNKWRSDLCGWDECLTHDRLSALVSIWSNQYICIIWSEGSTARATTVQIYL